MVNGWVKKMVDPMVCERVTLMVFETACHLVQMMVHLWVKYWASSMVVGMDDQLASSMVDLMVVMIPMAHLLDYSTAKRKVLWIFLSPCHLYRPCHFEKRRTLHVHIQVPVVLDAAAVRRTLASDL
jgi:hypothetical protein